MKGGDGGGDGGSEIDTEITCNNSFESKFIEIDKGFGDVG